MVRAPHRKSKSVKPRNLSLRATARRLGVSHSHLSRVLRGIRHSRTLTIRYRELVKEAA